MPYRILALLILASAASACQPQTDVKQESPNKISNPQSPRSVIYDTDFGGDADDLGALIMLHRYADEGLVDLLAVGSWAREEKAIQAIDAVNTYYGRPDLALGVRKVAPWVTEWSYAYPIAERFDYDVDHHSAPDVVSLYREKLSQAADRSVTIITVGPLANIKNLIESAADKHSPLSGDELINQKVKQFVVMGGRFSEGGVAGQPEWNFSGNMPGVTKFVLNAIERPMVFSGFEVGKALTVGSAIEDFDPQSPLHIGYEHFSQYAPWMKNDFIGTILDNASFDQSAVMYAALPDHGLAEHWVLSKAGKVSASEEGTSSWTETPAGNHRYMILVGDTARTADMILNQMMYSPN